MRQFRARCSPGRAACATEPQCGARSPGLCLASLGAQTSERTPQTSWHLCVYRSLYPGACAGGCIRRVVRVHDDDQSMIQMI